MKLVDASSYFDRTEALDPVTGRVLFLGQIGSYDDSKRDASSAYRRVLSVRPGTAIPASRAVKMLGVTWIIGNMEPDGLEELYRNKYVLQQSQGSFNVSRLAGFLSGSVANTQYASAHWVKDAKQLEVSSVAPHLFDLTTSATADVRLHDVIWNASQAFLVLSPRQQPSGYLISNSLELDQIVPIAATITGRQYDPVLGEYTAPTAVVANSLVVRWQSLFEYGSQASERYQEGDVSIVLPLSAVVDTASTVTVGPVVYQVLAVMEISEAVVVHARAL